jgi:hypothetical protein
MEKKIQIISIQRAKEKETGIMKRNRASFLLLLLLYCLGCTHQKDRTDIPKELEPSSINMSIRMIVSKYIVDNPQYDDYIIITDEGDKLIRDFDRRVYPSTCFLGPYTTYLKTPQEGSLMYPPSFYYMEGNKKIYIKSSLDNTIFRKESSNSEGIPDDYGDYKAFYEKSVAFYFRGSSPESAVVYSDRVDTLLLKKTIYIPFPPIEEDRY